MSILDQLSSRIGDRTEEANRKVVALCLARPVLLAEIAERLTSSDAALIGDCAEVLTKVAEARPELVVPHAKALTTLLDHKTTRVRWEAIHALALIASSVPKIITPLLPRLKEILHSDSSTIVRDHAVDTIGNFAMTGKRAAQAAHPILIEALTLWDGKHAARALNGLSHVAAAAPGLADDLRAVGFRYGDDGRGVVRKAAKSLIRALES